MGDINHNIDGKMARAIFVGAKHEPKWIIEKRSFPPDIDDGEVLVRIRLATICGSDIHTVNGTRIAPTPLVLGHEAVGEIVEDKRNLDGIKRRLPAGTRVTFSIAASCFKCERCRLMLPEKCEALRKVGSMSVNNKSGFNGCYATHIVLRRGAHVVPVPLHLTDRVVAPVNCALATMINVVEKAKSGVRDKTALILGAGLLGLYGCALLRETGYEKVYCSDVSMPRLKYVPQFGAEPVHSDQFRDRDFLADEIDVVIEVCGNPNVVQDGFHRVRYGGIYILVGLVHPNSQLSLTGEQIIRKCVTIKGVHNYAPRHLDAALDFLSKTVDKYPYDELLSPNQFSLDRIDQAINEAEKRVFFRSCLKPT